MLGKVATGKHLQNREACLTVLVGYYIPELDSLFLSINNSVNSSLYHLALEELARKSN